MKDKFPWLNNPSFQWEFLKDETMRTGEHMKQNISHKC